MFKTRLLSGIVLVAVALFTIISGGYVLYGTLLAVSLLESIPEFSSDDAEFILDVVNPMLTT